MTLSQNKHSDHARPDISFIMPCYNEEEIIGYTIPNLVTAFEKAGHVLELIAVDNGSQDQTGKIIKELETQSPSVVYHHIDKNEGYGNGVLSAIPLCSSYWIGIIPADGQVDAIDVVHLYETAASSNGQVLVKVRRRFRMDGALRKIISVAYNLFVLFLWPRIKSIDINGSPKILPRDVLIEMCPQSKDWFLDPEIMIKAHYMGIKILELNVFSRLRGGGLSHINMVACWQFFKKLLIFRFSQEWKKGLKRSV